MIAYVIVFVLLLGVVLIVTSPLRAGERQLRAGGDPRTGDGQPGSASEREDVRGQRLELEAARDAKLREIRDAELDHQTGKLSDADFEAIDSTLRAEAVELLGHLDALDEGAGAGHVDADRTGPEPEVDRG